MRAGGYPLKVLRAVIAAGFTVVLIVVTLLTFVPSRPHHPMEVAHEVQVRCGRDGSIEVSPSVVAARRDGVHVIATLESRRRTYLEGLEVDVKGSVVEVVSPSGPGEHEVRCKLMNATKLKDVPSALVRVTDPGDNWVRPLDVECPPGQGRAGSSGSASGSGRVDGAAAILRARYAHVLRPSDRVNVSGYAEGTFREFQFVRNGRAFFAGDAFYDAGAWTFTNLEFCFDPSG